MKDVLIKLKNEELKILLKFDEICKKYCINYFIMYGTLLGAVRHKGFIPWDDDIDIGMLREDYEKFINIAQKELNENYFIDNEKNNSKYYLPFTKLRNKNIQVYEESTNNYNGDKGCWIDIFPFEYLKTNEMTLFYKIKFKILNILYVSLMRKSLKISYSKKITLLSYFLPYKFIFFLIKVLSINRKKSNYILHYGLEGINGTEIYNLNDIFPLKKYKFENYEFYGPRNYDNILKQTYGENYMELPPVDKRITHNIVKIEFKKTLKR